MNTLRAIGFVRVSQRDYDTGQSPEVQTGALRQMAELHAWSLDAADIADQNIDNGRIHKTSRRPPKLCRAIEEIEAGHAKILAAENFDRLPRNGDVQSHVRLHKMGDDRRGDRRTT